MITCNFILCKIERLCHKQLIKEYACFFSFVFADPEFISGLRYQFQRMKRDDSNIEDVCDVALYQRDLLNEFYVG